MITFANVTKVFPTGQSALTDISFQIDQGEFVFIVGESGAGKTTLMRLLLKEYAPTKGEITFNETNLVTLKKHFIPKLRRDIGVVFQDYKLLMDRTVAENVGLALEITGHKPIEIEHRVKELLDLVGLAGKEEHFPKQLSGGESQRVSIARALATSPKLLFADEPTGNLDNEVAESIMQLFESIHKLGTTVMMATHNLNVVKHRKHRELQLHQGKLIKDTKSQKEKAVHVKEKTE